MFTGYIMTSDSITYKQLDQDYNAKKVTMKTPKYFPYLITFCTLLCLALFTDTIFLLQNPKTISKFTAQLEFVAHFFIIISSFKIYKNAEPEAKNILVWFIVINVGLLLIDLNGYIISDFHDFIVSHIGLLRFLLFFLTFFIWVIASTIFLYKILKNYITLKNQQTSIFAIFAPINLILIAIFMSYMHYSTGDVLWVTLSQIIVFTALVIVFDSVILCLIYAENHGLILFLLGLVCLISGYFFIIYITFSHSNSSTNVEMFQTYSSAYGQIIWFLGLLLNWFGILMIKYQGDYKIKNWVKSGNNIKSKLIMWCFSIAIIGFLLFFIMAYTFNLINKTMLLGLPVYFMIYSSVIIVLSIYIGKYIETTSNKFEYLESIAELIPAAFYLVDLNYRYVGANRRALIACDATNREDLVGRTAHEHFPQDVADRLQADFTQVITTGVTSQQEDTRFYADTGKTRYFSATRAPLRNKKGDVIGIVGTSIEITAEKETARLKHENEINAAKILELKYQEEKDQALLNEMAALAKAEQLRLQNEKLEIENKSRKLITEEQEKFKKVVGQMMHDITSPVASINTIVSKLGSNIPENDRVTLKNAAERVECISQRLLKQYENKDTTGDDREENLLVSLALLQIMNEKREEYLESGINFVVKINDDARLCFILHNSGIFKRMISNLVNNAVDALKAMDTGGNLDGNIATREVTITLAVNAGSIVIIVKDNGPGMPQSIIDKFNQGIAVTEGKDKGHGIGLTQVREAINFGKGEYNINASEIGTKIIIYFPVIAAPRWIATEIKLTKNDTVIILDDDGSIHGAWDHKFAEILAQIPTLKIKHYSLGKDVIEYINNLTPEQKHNTFLLTDYELLEQGMNGLDVVEQTNMRRATLVTSYATNSNIQARVTKLGIKTLPKELVSAVEIKVDKKLEKASKIVDMVWVEDQQWYVDGLIKDHYSHLKVDVYYDPVSFMECVIQYPLTTKIILDTFYEYPNGDIYVQTGYDLAHELHVLGYTKLIIVAGEDPNDRAPEYLQVVRKKDGEATGTLDKI